MYDSSKSRYDVILGRYILTLRLYFKVSDHVTKGCDGPFESCIPPMVDLSMNNFKFKYN